MGSLLSTILRGINRKDNDRLNILCVNEDEAFQALLARTGHNFFFLRHPQIRSWDVQIRPVPRNCYMLSGRDINDQLKGDLSFDLLLSQNRQTHYQLLSQLSKQMNCPIVSVNNELSAPDANPYYVEALANQEYNLNTYNSEFVCNSWGFDISDEEVAVVDSAVDIELFSGWEGGDGTILSVADHFPQRDAITGFSLWRQVAEGMPVNVLGNSPGFSVRPGISDLIKHYKKASVFFNTSSWQACPVALLEAMAVGCPIVTVPTTTIPDFIEDGVNGYMSNDPDELKERLTELLDNTDRATELGRHARETAMEKFNPSRFAKEWSEVFTRTIDKSSCLVVSQG